jgi:DNA-binding transcriptional regulator YhcF (GntR family)
MKRFGLILAVVVVIAGAALGYAGRSGSLPGGHGHPGPLHRFAEELTEEQREAIHDTVMEMREAGASREEVREAVREMLEGYGIELPGHGPEHPGPHGKLGELLNEEQRQEVHDMVMEMREAGASREEIHEAVRAKLEGYGIELPEHGPGHRGPRHKLGELLNEEQRQAVHDTVMEMREAGASREEIREAVHEMLEGYGVELPPRSDTGEADASTLSSEYDESATWGLIKESFK